MNDKVKLIRDAVVNVRKAWPDGSDVARVLDNMLSTVLRVEDNNATDRKNGTL